MYPEHTRQNVSARGGTLVVLTEGWDLEDGFIGREVLDHRDRFVGRLARRLVDPSRAVVVPCGPLTYDRYDEVLDLHGIDRGASWTYGVVLPDELVQRMLKAQVHPPLDPDRPVPPWFDPAFPDRIEPATLPGYSCFTEACLREAGETLLDRFARVRLKDPCGASGKHQTVVSDHKALERAIEDLRRRCDEDLEAVLGRRGMVVEADLGNVEVWSVTRTTTSEHTFTSIGRQLHTSTGGAPGGPRVYGGTVSLTVPGGVDALRALDLDGGQVVREDPVTGDRVAVSPDDEVLRAGGIHLDALRGWERDGIVHTRANVDVVKGELTHRDGGVETTVATLETSGRVGGASPSELLGALDLLGAGGAPFAVRSSHYLTPTQAGPALEERVRRAGGTVVWDGRGQTVTGEIVMACVL